MIISKQKCCLLLAGVSTESLKHNYELQTKRAFLGTRSMTRINVGLALSYVKLLLSSWKTYMCNLKAWICHGTFEIVSQEVLLSIWGSHQTLWSLPLPNVTWHILGHDHIQWRPQLIRYYTNLRTYYRTGHYYRFCPYNQILEVSVEHCNGCG